jgi:hypothetical protein
MSASNRGLARRAPHLPAAALLAPAAGLLLALAWQAIPEPTRAAEWTVPPGINVASQESVLKERVTRAARALVGEHLIDVFVHIGYVRMERRGAAGMPDRIKLPGFNNYIVSSGGEQPEIVSEFTRVRQAFAMVSDQAKIEPDALARELAGQTGMNPAQGDTLSVVLVHVPAQAAEGKEAGEARAAAKPEQPGPPGMPSMAAQAPSERPVTPEELKEPQSTAHLMQARRRYFTGDYQGALEEILQAITVEPNNAQAYAMLGSLYYAMNWKSLAVKYWQRSLELDPTNREIEDLITQILVKGL